MKRTIIVIFTLFSSCMEPEKAQNFTLINSSGVVIELQDFYSINEITYLKLEPGEKNNEIGASYDGEATASKIKATISLDDSIVVVYNNEVKVVHRRGSNNVSRSLLDPDSYEGGERQRESNSFSRYEFTYTFTEEDYQEALLIGEKL